MIVLPVMPDSDQDCPLWSGLPTQLAALLAVIPRDSQFACNAATRDAVTGQGSPANSPWELLHSAVHAGAAISALPPCSTVDTTEWLRSLPELAPKRPRRERDWLLKSLKKSPAESHLSKSREATTAIALQAGIFQWHDYLDESHGCSQQIEGEGPGQLGDYWHGIMHRREPDYSNAKYWFRHVGRQSIFPEVARAADRILAKCSVREAAAWREKVVAGGRWDPFAFIDLCELCESRKDELNLAARHVQFVEMELLLRETCRVAMAG